MRLDDGPRQSPAEQACIVESAQIPDVRWLGDYIVGWHVIFIHPLVCNLLYINLLAPSILRFVTVGQPRTSLNRNSTDKDLNYTAKKTTNMTVGFVNYLTRHNKPWTNRKVKRLHHTSTMGGDLSHTGVTDMISILKEADRTHSLHINSQDKEDTHLTV